MSAATNGAARSVAGRYAYQRGEVTVEFEPRPTLVAMSVRHAHHEARGLAAVEDRLKLQRGALSEGVPEDCGPPARRPGSRAKLPGAPGSIADHGSLSAESDRR